MKERLKDLARRALGKWFFPELAELESRLKTVHLRMQEMYWEEKAKHAALGLIELLQEEIHRLDPENEVLRKIREMAGGSA